MMVLSVVTRRDLHKSEWGGKVCVLHPGSREGQQVCLWQSVFSGFASILPYFHSLKVEGNILYYQEIRNLSPYFFSCIFM